MPARTTLDIPITVPAGDARKLVVLWGSDGAEFPTAATFDPAGVAIPMVRIESAVHPSSSLRAAAYILDTPPEGAKVVRFVTTNPVWSVVSVKVYQNARAGSAAVLSLSATGTRIGELLDELFIQDAYSETCDLVLGLGLSDGSLTPFAGQTAGADDVSHGTFLATTSDRTHAHNGEVNHGWTAAAATDLLMIVVNVLFSSGQVATQDAVELFRWDFDEVSSPWQDNVAGRSPAALQPDHGTVSGGHSTLVSGGVASISMQGALITAPHHVAAEVASWSAEIYPQPRAWPTGIAPQTNFAIFGKDTGLPARGGFQVEVESNGAIDFYIRDGTGLTGTGIHVTGASGSGILTLNTAHVIHLTYDDTTKTAAIYLDRNPTPLATKSTPLSGPGPYFAGLTENTAPFSLFSRDNATGVEFNGIGDRVTFFAGVLTAAEIAARPAPTTITDPLPPGPITANSDPLQIVVEGSSNFVDVLENDTGKTADYQFNFDFPTNPSSRLGIDQDGTANARVKITMPPPATTDRNESGTYRVRQRPAGGSYGAFSNQATITWRQIGTGGDEEYEPFPFVTTLIPTITHSGVANRPGYSSSNPLSQQIIDPMSGIPIVRVTGNRGATINTYTTSGTVVNSGLVWPLCLRNDNTTTAGRIFNADGSLLFLDQSDADSSYGNEARSVLVDCSGDLSGGVRFRVIRASASVAMGNGPAIFWFWDPLNPRRAYCLNDDGGMDEWYPAGGDGRPVDYRAQIPHLNGFPSGYDSFLLTRAHNVQPSGNGMWYMQHCRRTSDNRPGGRRRNLLTGALGSFIPTPHIPFDDTQDRNAQGISPLGNWTKFIWDGHSTMDDVIWYNTVTGAQGLSGDGNGELPSDGMSHLDTALINGSEYGIGPVDSAGVWMVNLNAKTARQVSNISTGNPNHWSSRNYKDLAETYGAVGGMTTGNRYGIFFRSGGSSAGIRGIRLGPSDFNVTRFIAHHRGVRVTGGGLSTNDSETHGTVSPDGRLVVFNSNWRLPGAVSDYQQNAYVVLVPEGWWRPNNDGLTGP